MFKNRFIKLCNQKGVAPTAVCLEIGLNKSSFSYWDEHTIPRATTLQKIADYFGVTVEYLKGEEKAPGVVPKRSDISVTIPVYGNVAAGIPLEAITDIEDYEEIPADIASIAEYIALRIHGDSMEPKMSEGDVVIVRLQSDVENGEIAIVMVDGNTATCKKIKKTDEGMILVALNPDYEPIFYSNKQIDELPVRILGKVVELRAKF